MRTEHVDEDGRTIVRDDTVALTDQELRDSYERGRVDERSRHRRNWLTTILGAILALIGIIVLVLAALNGSFQRAGAVIDRQLSIAADQAEPVVRDAADDATDALRNAGDNDAVADPNVAPAPAEPQPAPNTATTAPEAR